MLSVQGGRPDKQDGHSNIQFLWGFLSECPTQETGLMQTQMVFSVPLKPTNPHNIITQKTNVDSAVTIQIWPKVQDEDSNNNNLFGLLHTQQMSHV